MSGKSVIDILCIGNLLTQPENSTLQVGLEDNLDLDAEEVREIIIEMGDGAKIKNPISDEAIEKIHTIADFCNFLGIDE